MSPSFVEYVCLVLRTSLVSLYTITRILYAGDRVLTESGSGTLPRLTTCPYYSGLKVSVVDPFRGSNKSEITFDREEFHPRCMVDVVVAVSRTTFTSWTSGDLDDLVSTGSV